MHFVHLFRLVVVQRRKTSLTLIFGANNGGEDREPRSVFGLCQIPRFSFFLFEQLLKLKNTFERLEFFIVKNEWNGCSSHGENHHSSGMMVFLALFFLSREGLSMKKTSQENMRSITDWRQSSEAKITSALHVYSLPARLLLNFFVAVFVVLGSRKN